MKNLIFTIALFILAIITVIIPYSKSFLFSSILMVVVWTFLVGILSGLLLTFWFKGSFKTKLIKALKLSYPLTLIFYLVGYSIPLIETLIR
ncbi:hypothetical protein SCB49_14785 [unidentified eubacterium SCB49]|nr:hypothetical protein SCB49_14785 [unidentified eubacterium SCB49]